VAAVLRNITFTEVGIYYIYWVMKMEVFMYLLNSFILILLNH